ncbi:crystallin J1A-like, partial [Saccoglossus kowalevskii]
MRREKNQTQPLHWIYNATKLEEALKGPTNPEFRPESLCPFYTQDTGKLSCYGDHSFIVLESLAEKNGVDVGDYGERLYKYYGAGTEAEKARQSKAYPVAGPWTNYDISDMHTCSVAIPVVAKYAGKPEMLENVRKIIEVTSLNEEAITIGLVCA